MRLDCELDKMTAVSSRTWVPCPLRGTPPLSRSKSTQQAVIDRRIDCVTTGTHCGAGLGRAYIQHTYKLEDDGESPLLCKSYKLGLYSVLSCTLC